VTARSDARECREAVSLYWLRRPGNSNKPEAVAAQLDQALAGVPGIPGW